MELDEKSKREIRDANKRKEMIGVILDLFNQVDSLLSDVINGYFTRERLKERRQFSELILDKISFERKKQILRVLDFEEERGIEFEGKLFEDLDEIQRVRNILAHNSKILDKETRIFKVPYPKNSEIKWLWLDDKFLDNLFKRISQTLENILKIKILFQRDAYDRAHPEKRGRGLLIKEELDDNPN